MVRVEGKTEKTRTIVKGATRVIGRKSGHKRVPLM